MLITASILFAANVTLKGYVPPHLASDGARFEVTAATTADLPAAMRACGIDDFAAVMPQSGADIVNYQLAVPRGALTTTQCLLARLPAGARLMPIDHWTKDAQAD